MLPSAALFSSISSYGLQVAQRYHLLCSSYRKASSSSLFSHSMQMQNSPHFTPFSKHRQYFFWQCDFLQVQKMRSLTTGSLAWACLQQCIFLQFFCLRACRGLFSSYAAFRSLRSRSSSNPRMVCRYSFLATMHCGQHSPITQISLGVRKHMQWTARQPSEHAHSWAILHCDLRLRSFSSTSILSALPEGYTHRPLTLSECLNNGWHRFRPGSQSYCCDATPRGPWRCVRVALREETGPAAEGTIAWQTETFERHH